MSSSESKTIMVKAIARLGSWTWGCFGPVSDLFGPCATLDTVASKKPNNSTSSGSSSSSSGSGSGSGSSK